MSLTSIVAKVMEHIIRKHVVDHMARNKLFSNKQYGFMNGRSTALQLLTVLDAWTEAIEDGHYVDCVYMDLMKAFDKVPHKRLMTKLKHYGITGKTFECTCDFLSNRKQYIELNGNCSKWYNVISGIPQGTVFRPYSFCDLHE